MSEKDDLIIYERLEAIPYFLPESLTRLHDSIDAALASRTVDAGSAKDFDPIIISAFVEAKDSLNAQRASNYNRYVLREAERALLIERAERMLTAAKEERDIAAEELKRLYSLRKRTGV